MDLFRIILLNLLILNVLLWINHEILHIFRFKKRVLLYSLGWWVIAGLVLLAYWQLMHYIPYEQWTLQQGHSILSFIPLTIVVGIILVISRQPRKKTYLHTISMTLLTTIAIYILINYVWDPGLQVTGGYFLLIAYAEEHIKLIGVRNKANTLLIKKSDLILCWIISGLWFACIESIAVSTTLAQSIGRFPLFFVHAIFTGYIAYWLYKNETQEQKRRGPAIAVSVISIHTLYNLWAGAFTTITRIVISTAFYILYIIISKHSDALYYQKTV